MTYALLSLGLVLLGTTVPQAPRPSALTTPAPAAAVNDPHQLAIGRPGRVKAGPGLTDLRTGRPATLADVVRAAQGVRFVLVGESHDNAAHHQFQADVIAAMANSGRPVIVGFEQFTFPRQRDLNAWSLGGQTEADFITASQWKTEWGFAFEIYRPIFTVAREHRIPLVALNVPRDWVRTVGRGGPEALPAEAYGQVPPLHLDNQAHQAIFGSLMGGHPMTGDSGRRMYAAQVLWDEGMADRALRAFGRRPGTRAAMVILAGNGHVMYGEGIATRITARTKERTLTITTLDKDAPAEVARGLGDFAYRAP